MNQPRGMQSWEVTLHEVENRKPLRVAAGKLILIYSATRADMRELQKKLDARLHPFVTGFSSPSYLKGKW